MTYRKQSTRSIGREKDKRRRMELTSKEREGEEKRDHENSLKKEIKF